MTQIFRRCYQAQIIISQPAVSQNCRSLRTTASKYPRLIMLSVFSVASRKESMGRATGWDRSQLWTDRRRFGTGVIRRVTRWIFFYKNCYSVRVQRVEYPTSCKFQSQCEKGRNRLKLLRRLTFCIFVPTTCENFKRKKPKVWKSVRFI